MGFADDLINSRKKKEEASEDFANQVINGTYRVPQIKVSPDLSGLSRISERINSNKSSSTESKKTTTTSKKKKKKQWYEQAWDFANDIRKTVLPTPIERAKDIYNIGKATIDNAPKVMTEIDNFKRLPAKEKAEVAGKTALSTIQNFGEGALRYGVESKVDAASNIFGGASDWVNTKIEKAAGMHKGKSEKEVNKEKGKARKEMIKQDTTGALMELAGKDEFYKDLIEDKSLVKSDNELGKIAQQAGGQAVDVILANEAGKLKVKANPTSKIGKFAVENANDLIQMSPYGVTSYGTSVQEAYQNGADWKTANRYGMLNAAVEMATEKIGDGIPGVEGTKGKGLDKIFEKIINEPIEQTSSTITKAALKAGYKLGAEITEEEVSNFINPFVKQFTYNYKKDKGFAGNMKEAVNNLPTYEEMIQTAIETAVLAGLFEAPSTINDFSSVINNKQNGIDASAISHGNVLFNEKNTDIVEEEKKQNVNENTQSGDNISVKQIVSQKALNLPTSNNIKSIEEVVGNTNTQEETNNYTSYEEGVQELENLKKFNDERIEKLSRQQQEETNERLDTLEEQLEKQGTRILEESEIQREKMIESFKEYLEENNITNPTQQDIDNSIIDTLGYDNELDYTDTMKLEKLYNKYVKEYMQENGIPFNNEIKTVQPLNKRVSGDELLDAQDLIDEVKSVGAKVDDNGYITVYHQTTPEAAQEIRNTGKMISKEPYVYFSTSENASQADGRGQVKLEFRIPAESLILDDIFSDNADVKIKLNGKNLDVSNYIVNNQSSIPTTRDFNRVNLPTVENNLNNNYNNIKGSDNDVSRTNESNRTDSLLQNQSNRQNGGYNNSNQEQTDSERNKYVYSPKSYDVGSRTVREVFGEKARTNVDSKGKKLTEDQNNFYANDMVRNADGNLLVVYHGTKEQFDAFDKSKIGSNTHNVGMFGCGFYFTENKALAGSYNWAENVPNNYEPMALYVNITNPFYWNGIKTEEQMNEFIQKIGLEEGILTWNRYAQEIHTIKEEDKAREFSKKLQENGYDGIIYKYDHGQTTSEIVAFEPNQIKSVDNLHPTAESDDIYERTNESSFSLPTKQEAKEIPKKELNLPKNLANKKVEQKVNQQGLEAIKKAANAGKSYLQLKYNEVKTLKSELKEYLGLSKEELTNAKTYNGIKEKVKQFINRQVEYLDEDLKRVKNEIRNANIKVDSELKEQITDYNDFKKSNFGKLKLSTTGQNIDSIYQELSDQYPYYFDSSITSEADMLYELSDFMNKSNTITEEYKLSDEDIDNATNKIFNSLVDNSLTNEEIETIQNDLLEKYSKRTRKVVQEELLEDMNIKLEDIAKGKDISSLEFQRTDPIRVNEKVYGAETGQKINDATINYTKHMTAEKTRFLNKERNDIKELGIKPRSKESAAVQKYGEKQYINDKGEITKYGDKELTAEFKDETTRNKIKHAAEVIRNKYDKYIDRINEIITNMGYDPIPKRPDYMRHFQELNDKLSKWGIPLNPTDMSKDTLPTDINGITDQFKPGKNWFASAMERKGLKTTYDAITGIDGYLEGASNLIYYTEAIQRYRALSKFIRDTYGQQHGMDNIDPSTEEGQKRLNDIFDNKLSKYAAWLDEQANALAGKKGGIDRAAERLLGRKVYTVLDAAKKQVGSNMTGFNVRSAMTNFASAVQGASKTNKLSFIKGTISTLKNMVHNDGLIDKSDFLTNRFGSDQLSKKLWQKASNAGQVFMTGTDYFTANQIWRSKYYENLSKGMSESQAIKKADDFASRIMGDRSKGSTAEIFNSKTLGLLTQFQLEVNNQWSSIIHDNKMDLQTGNKSGATVMFQLGQLAAMSYLFNGLMKSLTGSDVMIDPIDMLKKMIGDDDDEDKSMEDRAKEVLGDLVDDLPFASFMTGGRIPMQEAFKGVDTLKNYAIGKTDKYGNKITLDDVKNDVIGSAYYWLFPTGYGQLRKTTQGMGMYSKKLPVPGSYTKSGNLRFNADESTGGKVKAALFGQYSSKESQEYIKSGYKSIRKEKLDEMKELDMQASEYRKYREELNKAGTKNSDKIDYIANSDYSDEAKDIMAKNVLGRDFDINEYEKYDSYEEYDYAQKYPEKYLMNKQIAPYDKYNTYKDKIKNIRDNTTNDKAETIKYINGLNMSIPQKAMFIKQYYKSFKSYDKDIINYINDQDLTIDEKSQILTQLGFTVRNGRVY